MQTAYHLSRGLRIGLDGDRIAVAPRENITPDVRATICGSRDELVIVLRDELEPPCPHDVAERAAILEFDGGHSREVAERLALSEFGLSSFPGLTCPNAGRSAT